MTDAAQIKKRYKVNLESLGGNNVDTWLVPLPDALPRTKVVDFDLLKERFRDNRKSVLSGLACLSGLPLLASSLRNDVLYRVILSPGAGKLKKGMSGFYEAVVRNKDGTIVEHAKLEKVLLQGDLASSLVTCGMQMQMAMMAAQLAEIQQGIEDIKDYLHNERVSNIRRGVRQFQQALRTRDEERMSRLVEQSISMLNSGVSSVIDSLNTEIGEVKQPWITVSIIGREVGIRSAKKKLNAATESFGTALFGIQAISECYATLGESSAAAFALKTLVEDLNEKNIEDASRMTRRLLSGDNPWQRFIERAPEIVAEAELNIDVEGRPKEFALDFMPQELSA